MTGIQIILISGFLLATVFYFIRWRNNIADLLLFFFLSLAAILFVLFPDWTNLIAHKLGVGRGADLVLYLCVLLFSFLILKLYSRLRKLEKTITDLIRKEAIKSSETPDKKA
ncbi:MAG: DUF2304 domain-containing protein [Chitinophagaceae bacterium]|nr:DUF2304 domain-containing protein [Chitinophagaceae bacterium]